MAAQKERRRKQHATTAEKGMEAEKIRNRNLEEGADSLEDDESDILGDLDSFIGKPQPVDVLIDALIVCGPWDAIGGRCRWKAKLQPGGTKK